MVVHGLRHHNVVDDSLLAHIIIGHMRPVARWNRKKVSASLPTWRELPFAVGVDLLIRFFEASQVRFYTVYCVIDVLFFCQSFCRGMFLIFKLMKEV